MTVTDLTELQPGLSSGRRRRVIRVAVPVAAVILTMLTLAGIATFSYRANRSAALALADDLLDALQGRIVNQVESYLLPASRMTVLARDVLESGNMQGVDRALAEPIGIPVLKNYPQLAMFNLGDASGDFLMLKRMPSGSIDTKMIDRSEEPAKVEWLRRDTEGRVVAVEPVLGDTYDPRVRPWYVGALSTGGLYWSDVYVFATDQVPGITAAVPVAGQGGEPIGVVGVDITLSALSEFLEGLRIGVQGRAMILDENGRLVAFPEQEAMLKRVGDQLLPRDLKELNDPVLTRAYNRYLVEGDGVRELEVDGESFISAVSSLRATVQRDWALLIVVPESDFTGFVGRNLRAGIIMASVLVLIASFLAALLVRQGLRADRNAAMVLERQAQLEAQSGAYAELASKTGLLDPENAGALRELTEIVARTMGVRRVSLWRLFEAPSLVCIDCYDAESMGHTQGVTLNGHEFPQLFEVLCRGDELLAADAGEDPRTAELDRAYLNPLGCHSLFSVPIVGDERVLGVLWLESELHQERSHSERANFVRAIANVLALRFSGATFRASPMAGAPRVAEDGSARDTVVGELESGAAASQKTVEMGPDMNVALLAPDRAGNFMERALDHARKRRAIGADVLSNISVLVLRVTNPLVLAESSDDDESDTAVERLIIEIEQLARRCGLSYLKFTGDQIVGAAGFDGDDIVGAQAVADTALGIQGLCRSLFSGLDARMGFTIGIDTGPAVGSRVGRTLNSYNLWGDAVRTAQMMSETALVGRIQVTESSYRLLSDHYLFRARGAYFLEHVGELSTYLLTGKL